MNNTQDLSQFGDRELRIAIRLLRLIREQNFLTTGIHIEFNPSSGFVFLTDDDFNVGVLNSDNSGILQFLNCAECGYEGTAEDYKYEKKMENALGKSKISKCCKEYFEVEQ